MKLKLKLKKLNIFLLTLLASVFLFSCTKSELKKTETSQDKKSTTDSIKSSGESNTIPDTSKLSKATFAAGCFWCEEAVFESVKGVGEVISGYSGGKTKNPTYEEVGSGTTGHAESFQVYYDSSQINYETLLKVFFASQDPTQVNGQGPDDGTQYRSIIFYRNAEEKQLAEKYINDINKSGKYDKPVATEVVMYTVFWPAEKYHQDYIMHNPDESYVQHESIPRLRRTQKQIPELIKPDKSVIDK